MSVTPAKARKRRAVEALTILALVACTAWSLKPAPPTAAPPTGSASPNPVARTQAGPGLLQLLQNPLERANDVELERLTELLKQDPDNPDFLYRRSLIYRARGKVGAQLSDLEHIIKARPDQAGSAYNERAWILAHQGRYHEAERDVNKAVGTLGVNTVPTQVYILIGTGKEELVLPLLDGWLAVKRYDTEALWARGTALRRMGKEKEAQADFDRASKIDPDYSTYWPICVECAGDESK